MSRCHLPRAAQCAIHGSVSVRSSGLELRLEGVSGDLALFSPWGRVSFRSLVSGFWFLASGFGLRFHSLGYRVEGPTWHFPRGSTSLSFVFTSSTGKIVNRASGAGGYKWVVRGVIKFVPGGRRTKD